MATFERVNAIADNFIAALYPLPRVTLIPLFIIWLATGGPFMLTISALGAIFPIVINTVLGIRQCDPGLILAARDLGATQRQIVRLVLRLANFRDRVAPDGQLGQLYEVRTRVRHQAVMATTHAFCRI